MRAIPDSFDPSAVDQIDHELASIAVDHGVALPMAIESGSRAWGFPSPDSDYDCRFVFLRPLEHYLSPWPARDVIESPPTGLLDVNGWDLKKALQLLVKGNAVIIEWLQSPIVYAADAEFTSDFLALAARVANRYLLASHYFHVAETQWGRFVTDDNTAPLKKLFYALRPALAMCWLRQHPSAAVPPMSLSCLVAECDLPADLPPEIDHLVALKSVPREMGEGRVPDPVLEFVLRELAHHERGGRRRPAQEMTAARDDAATFFRSAITTYGPV